MNKDALLATLIGLGMGLIITGIIVVGPVVLKSIPKFSLPKISLSLPTMQQKSNPTPAPTPEAMVFSIESPIPDAVVTAGDLLVSGSTKPAATVVVQGETDEDVVVADGNGKYAGKIALSEGKNDVTVTSYNNKIVENKTIAVFHIP